LEQTSIENPCAVERVLNVAPHEVQRTSTRWSIGWSAIKVKTSSGSQLFQGSPFQRGRARRGLRRRADLTIQKQRAARGSSINAASPIALATSAEPWEVRTSNQASQMSRVAVTAAATSPRRERCRAAIAVVASARDHRGTQSVRARRVVCRLRAEFGRARAGGYRVGCRCKRVR
jgi:hypothetical protein